MAESTRYLNDKDGNIVYPVTKSRASLNDDGSTVASSLSSINSALSSLGDSVSSMGTTISQLDNNYQQKLVSGTNIKTINNLSLLGDGNIEIQGGSDVPTDTYELLANKVSSVSAQSTSTQYPSASATYVASNIPVVSTMPSGGMASNVFYDLGEISGSVTFSLAAAADSNVFNIWTWRFATGSVAPTVVWPSDIQMWEGDAPVVEASMVYEISVINGLAVCHSGEIPLEG